MADIATLPDSESEIEVTPAMIEAGARVLAEMFDQPVDWFTEERATAVYCAMSACRAATR